MFNRPPRIQEATKEYVINLIPPPQMPPKPKINWVTVGLPIFAVGLVIALMFIFSGTSGLAYLMFLPFILASVLASVITYYRQMKEYNSDLEANINIFREELKAKRDLIEEHKSEQLGLLCRKNPSPRECIDIVTKQETRIGERRPNDNDFLSFRLGLGLVDSGILVKSIAVENRDPLYKTLYEEADEIVKNAGVLSNAPVLCNLKDLGTIGIAGNIDSLREISWSITTQLLTHHWPSELNIASFCSFVEANNWKWLNRLEHRAKIFSTEKNDTAVIELRQTEGVKQSLVLLEAELRRRKSILINQRAISSQNTQTTTLPAIILIFDRISDIYNHAAFSLLLKEGRELGIYGIFLVDAVDDIPAECGAIISVEQSKIDYHITGSNPIPFEGVQPDEMLIDWMHTFTENLENIKWLIPQQVTDPPELLTLLQLFPNIRLDDLPLESWWAGDYPFGYLCAPIGKFSPTAELVFNLNDADNAHGPHGLIGGMTGSGKSELLKTLILSLSMTHHPYDLNFALIDYKGGGAFDGFDMLPHVVGVITDIQNHADYATRVIQSLSWEVKRREKILADARRNFELPTAHIDEYRSLRTKIPIPRLVIIFDEFAEFQERHPDESKKLINIARVGRSLGIHLILCTQNPMGKAVDQQVRDNSNFTICLKVKTPETSKALVNIPDAIQLKRGEAYFHVDGPQKFRVAYTAADLHLPTDSIPTNQPASRNRKYRSQRVSEAQAIIEEISLQARTMGIPDLPKIWPDPLPENLQLGDLFSATGEKPTWDESKWNSIESRSSNLPIALLDDPQHQKQPVFMLKDHLLIFGASRSGKSMALLTIAQCICNMYSPEEAHIYCVDISGQSPLRILKDSNLPHLPEDGGVIMGNDIERANRLFKMLQTEISLRGRGKAEPSSGASGSNKKSSQKAPKIFVLIDGVNQQFNQNNLGFKDQLDFVMRHGAPFGIYVVLTGNLMQDIPTNLQADRIIILLQPTDRGTIFSLVGKAPETYQKKIEAGQEPNVGRGIINTNPALEIQFALPWNEGDPSLQELSDEFEAMFLAWHKNRPPNVEKLPDFITLPHVALGGSAGQIAVGKSQESLEPVGFSISQDGPIFIISSMRSGLGKTSALQLWLLELLEDEKNRNLKLVLIDYHARTLRHFNTVANLVRKENFSTHVTRKEELKEVMSWLENEVRERRDNLAKEYSDHPDTFNETNLINEMGYILITIDDYEAFLNSKPNNADFQKLLNSIVDGEEVGVRLIITEDYALLGTDDLAKRARKYGCGILLGGSDGLSIFNDARPPYNQKMPYLPAGRGYLVRKGYVELIQTFTYWKKGKNPEEEIRTRLRKLGSR